MPKLNTDQRKAVEAASTGGYLLEEGRYLATLKECRIEDRPDKNGDERWTFVWGDLRDSKGEKRAGRQWDTISLGETSAFRMKAVYTALGYTTDSDTDEMIGEQAILIIKQEEQKVGKRAGEIVNRINGYAPFDPDTDTQFGAVAGTATAGKAKDDF